jgi:hypothetical protein
MKNGFAVFVKELAKYSISDRTKPYCEEWQGNVRAESWCEVYIPDRKLKQLVKDKLHVK